jgi:outer membrane receptor protein involved in Fe transport
MDAAVADRSPVDSQQHDGGLAVQDASLDRGQNAGQSTVTQAAAPGPTMATARAPVAQPAEQSVTVRGERPFTTASAASVRARDLEQRPRFRPADVLEVAPGLLVVQHAGGGKSNQYFLRGFDADHGTDIALSVDGVPFNNVSHGHGQGYADPHFVIPELVERVDVQEGPYFAASGDFATAGAIDLRLRRTVNRTSLLLDAAMYGRYRALAIVNVGAAAVRGYIAAELGHQDGPFLMAQNFNHVNVVGSWTLPLARGVDLSLTTSSYLGAWNASGQVPARLIDQPYLGRIFTQFDSIDPTEGGQSERHSLTAELRARGDRGSELVVSAYAVNYRLNLFSNFTFFANNPARGDMIEQSDSRRMGGVKASYRVGHRIDRWRFETTVGTQVRVDSIDNGLFLSQARRRYETVQQSAIAQASIGLYAQEDIHPTRWLRMVLGLRADVFHFGVQDLGSANTPPDPTRTGSRQALMASPKATVVLSPVEHLDFYLNYGSGFHSNDARGVVRPTMAVTPLARAQGYEVGMRWHTIPRLEVALSAWGIDLESEIVWIGDEGTTEARGPTRRLGLTTEARLDLTSWLRADVDLSVVHALFTLEPANNNAIALAPPFTLTAGLTANHPIGLSGAVRLRAIGDRPATTDRSLTAEGFAILSAQVGYRHRWFELSLLGENLLNSRWREAQFANESRLAHEPAAVSDIHFTPGTPLSVGLRLTLFAP